MAYTRVAMRALLTASLVCPVLAAEPAPTRTEKPSSADTQDAGSRTGHRRTRVRLGGITVGAGYARYSGYPWYPYSYWGPYSAFSPYGWGPWSYWAPWYYPGFHPGYFDGFRQGPGMGEVRLRSDYSNALVYLDGGYAGVVKDLKTMWLEPGAYDLQVKSPQGLEFARRIYVLSGKTLKIDAPLSTSGPAKSSGEEKP